MPSTDSQGRDQSAQDTPILILSADAVAAALLGALIETLGYSVKFVRHPETTDATIRRVRPRVCLLNCDDGETCNGEVLGRAAMRRISVVVFGTSAALERVRSLAEEHEIEMLLVPPELPVLEATLKRASLKAG
jgi:DNA-binding NtrC family response regulator